MFEPIAIVGQACLLPGAHSVASFWDALHTGQDLLSSAPPGYWRVDPALVLPQGKGSLAEQERCFCDRGGYVHGFDQIFDPTGFALAEKKIKRLDPLFQWLLHTGRQALGSLMVNDPSRSGVIVGNLSYPSHSLTALAESVWLQQQPQTLTTKLPQPAPENRFMSGYPAHVVAQALGLTGAAFCLDAACASSLYAVKLACDQLHDRQADLMLAGAINRADDLFLHGGFSALQALSRQGQSRPFHRHADGLLPAEGVAFVALKRLTDAERDGDPIAAVIRGVGLSNDGRSGGFLSPASEGQVRALRTAYDHSGLQPKTISFVECHATGTPIGDAEEVRSMQAVFQEVKSLPLGCLKSNLGHLITVSGLASILKITQAMAAGILPPSLHTDDPIDALQGTPFRLLAEAEPWQCQGPRRAAINSFGFGGNNAHLILEQYSQPIPGPTPTQNQSPIAIVGMGVSAGSQTNTSAFAAALFDTSTNSKRTSAEIELPLKGLRCPPSDLEKSVPQQNLMMQVAGEAVRDAGGLKHQQQRTGAFVGMQCDAEVARFGVRWRLSEWAKECTNAFVVDQDWLAKARDGASKVLEAAGVVGAMPNIPANRLNNQYDWSGYSFTLSSEELSGIAALQTAIRALRYQELDAALVGAVDLSCEPVHRQAAAAVLPASRQECGDAAVALVLKRLDDAERDGDQVYAVLTDQAEQPSEPTFTLDADQASLVTQMFGHAHCASGLLHVAAASLGCATRAQPAQQKRPAMPWLGRGKRIQLESFSRQKATVGLACAAGSSFHLPTTQAAPNLHCFAGATQEEVLAKLAKGEESQQGKVRLAMVCEAEDSLPSKIALARSMIQGTQHSSTLGAKEGIYFQRQPMAGELAFVFTGAAAAYAGMGRELLLAMPHLVDQLRGRYPVLEQAAAWVYQAAPETQIAPFDHLKGCALLCQAHAELSQNIFGLRPTATLGLSSGETNALYALGAWRDMDAMFKEITQERMYSHALAGDFASAQRYWGMPASERLVWCNWQVLAPVAEVRAAVAQEPRVALTIITSAQDCVIGGEQTACKRVVEQIGKQRALPLGHDLVVHGPELQPFAEAWQRIHQRKTYAVPGVRFYTNTTGSHYQASADRAAQALTGQALQTIDFPRTVENAWADGVRIFLEHGPRNALSRAISQTLGTREHLVVSLDQPARSSLSQATHAMAQLWTAGVAPDPQALSKEISKSQPLVRKTMAQNTSSLLYFPAHYPPVQFPPKPSGVTAAMVMAPAPSLPSVLDLLPVMSRAQPMPPPVTKTAPVVVKSPASSAMAATAGEAGGGLVTTATTAAIPSFSVDGPPPATAEHGLAAVGPLGNLMADMSSVHQSYMQRQSDLHQRFLRLQEQAWQQFSTTGPAAIPSEPSTPTTPTPPKPASPTVAPAPVYVEKVEDKPSIQLTPPPPKEVSVEPVVEQPTLDQAPLPEGPRFSREQLETLSSGKISTIFGSSFEQQDDYALQVRMPEPPLLLADRVTGIKGEPGGMGKGIVWTETDVPDGTWYLHRGRMPPGIMIESGQADLLLISWLGADFHNKGERAYRLLGCELTYHDMGLPKEGDTLCYDIHVDGHARHGDVRLFFFHYDCRVNDNLCLSVRNGQAGFFNEQELAESGGVLWSAEEDEAKTPAQLDPSPMSTHYQQFDAKKVQVLAEGKVLECFGKGFEPVACHTYTPTIPQGRMNMLHEITQLDPQGGPWKRGYLRAEVPISPKDWFFKGHFKNDPCMPGTLMADASLQTMAFYMISQGFSLHRDGWRFQPVAGDAYKFVCRGQVLPSSKHLVYELFVEEVIAEPYPTLYAALLCTSDGLKVFQCRRFGLRMVPDWPLHHMPIWPTIRDQPPRIVGDSGDVRGDYTALLACAWGQPSEAFGSMYARFDPGFTVPRLPGPPYHFMSRVLSVEGDPGRPVVGNSLLAEYDVQPKDWYLQENGHPVMPFSVLLEVLLQPCGWFGSFMGFATRSKDDLCIRNLDGDSSRQLIELKPNFGTLRIKVTLTKTSQMGPMALVFFHVDSYQSDQLVHTLNTSFGFFTQEALIGQVGLPVRDEMRAWRDQPSEFQLDLRSKPAQYFNGSLRLGRDRLQMLDEITGLWPTAGQKGLGRIRGSQKVDPNAWYFKAHFYQDPVQPGSLGLEALVQLLQCFMLAQHLGKDFATPRFEAIALREPLIWKYRGQVVPRNHQVTTELEITSLKKEETSILITAKGSLWVDGLRIYEVENLAMRIVEGAPVLPLGLTNQDKVTAISYPWLATPGAEFTLHRETDPWLEDHCPTYTVPTLPMTFMLDYLAAAALAKHPTLKVVGLRALQIHRWVIAGEKPLRLKTEVRPQAEGACEVVLWVWREAAQQKLSRFEPAAQGIVSLASAYPQPAKAKPALGELQSVANPYVDGHLFHGPQFQRLLHLQRGQGGAIAQLSAKVDCALQGLLNPFLLDAATHAIPHDELQPWFQAIGDDQVSYPHRVEQVRIFSATPFSGEVECVVQPGRLESDRFPHFHIQLTSGGQPWMEIELVEVLFPKGPLGCVDPLSRRAFLAQGDYVPDLSLSDWDGERTRLAIPTLQGSNWLPGTLEAVYQAKGSASELTRQVAIKEHVARKECIHPGQVQLGSKANEACCLHLPLTRFSVNVTQKEDTFEVRDEGSPALDLELILRYWRERLGATASWPVEDIFFALIRRFVRRVVVSDPEAFAGIEGRSVLFLGNHQVGIESLLFSVIAGGLNLQPVVTVAKAEHRNTWLGRMISLCQNYPGKILPKHILFFDRHDRSSMLHMLDDLKEALGRDGLSLMVHAEGTRALHCREPVKRLSSVFVDLAIEANLAIVPVRFSGGLPAASEPEAERFEFPIGYGQQDYYLGRPLLPEELGALPLADRIQRVLQAMNHLGPDLEKEVPNRPNPDFAQAVRNWSRQYAISMEYATIFQTLKNDSRCGQQVQQWLETFKKGHKALQADPESEWLASFWKLMGLGTRMDRT